MSYWREKVVVVTGASAGFGLVLADAYRRAGAHVVLAARTAAPLEAAAERLRSEGGDVTAVPTDVTDQQAVNQLFESVVDRCGRIDCLVNAAGRSMRKAVLETTAEDFQQLVELNLLGTVRCTRAAAPHLLAARGHLVNVSSLGGKLAARWLGAYPASKHAVTAYTQQLRLELGPEGLHVLLVCPGPIARDVEREVGERDLVEDLARLPASAAKPGGGVKTGAIQPEWLAARILRACERRQPEIVVPRAARLVAAAAQLSPRLGDWLIRRVT